MISVICCTIRDRMMENVFQNYENQNIKDKELIIVLNRNEMNSDKWIKRAGRSKNVSVYKQPKFSLGECLNFAVHKSKYDRIAKMDDDDYYTPQYLSEQVKALIKHKADVICKRTVYMYFEREKKFAIHLANGRENYVLKEEGGAKGATFVFRKNLCNKIKFPPVSSDEDLSFLRECAKHRKKIYVTDKNHYICLRRLVNQHTWNTPNQLLLQESKIICKTVDYKKILLQQSSKRK